MNNLDSFYTSDPAAFATEYFNYLGAVCRNVDTAAIGRFVKMLLDARDRDATVWFVGNGGSASTASHFANDLTIGTKCTDRPFRTVSLADNNSIITAVANDFGYDDIFARQLRLLARPGDVVVGISASGNSPNLVRCFEDAKKMGLPTFAITSFDGGQMRKMADDCIHVPAEVGEYGPAEDVHLILNHIVGAYLTRLVKAKAAQNG